MAEPFLLIDPARPPALRRIAGVFVLAAALAGSRTWVRQARLARALKARRPPAGAIRAGLHARNPDLAGLALAALARVPIGVATDLVAAMPLGAGLPVDRLAPAVLRRRGDRAARVALRRLARATPPRKTGGHSQRDARPPAG